MAMWAVVGLSSTSASNLYDVQIAGRLLGSVTTSPLQIQAVFPNDPFYTQQSSLKRLNIHQAWGITTGGSNIVAVVDTGVNLRHQDLVGRIWANQNEIPNNNIDDDGNGYVDDYQGYNFFKNNSDVTDGHGHGTGIASIVAANTNNRMGLAGIDWSSKIMVLKALDNLGGGDFEDVANAVRYAVDNGADVINMSFGANSNSSTLSSAINYATANDVVVVAASGNNSNGQIFYPARYPDVIAVGSIDNEDKLSEFSNYGANLDLVAPGENVIMAGRYDHEYVEGSGSSFAAAQVSGIVSLMLAHDSSLTPALVHDILTSTADTLGSGQSIFFGYGKPNALLAVQTKSEPVVVADAPDPNAKPADYRMQWIGQSSYPALKTGEEAVLWVDLKNVGTTTWVSQRSPSSETGQIRLGTDRAKDRASVFYHASWLSTNRVGTLSPAVVKPGETGRFTFSIKANQSGPYREYFGVVAEGVTWLNDLGIYWDIDINGTSASTSDYRASLSVATTSFVASPGEMLHVSMSFKNMNDFTWSGIRNGEGDVGQVRLGTASPRDHQSIFSLPTWLSDNRVVANQLDVGPGSTMTMGFYIFAPSRAGTYRDSFQLVAEHVAWFGPVVDVEVIVN
jgi:hypothetical protein